MGMTWRFKVRGVVFALVIMGALALASGAQFIDSFTGLDWSSW
jgi:hypothetical protein